MSNHRITIKARKIDEGHIKEKLGLKYITVWYNWKTQFMR